MGGIVEVEQSSFFCHSANKEAMVAMIEIPKAIILRHFCKKEVLVAMVESPRVVTTGAWATFRTGGETSWRSVFTWTPKLGWLGWQRAQFFLPLDDDKGGSGRSG